MRVCYATQILSNSVAAAIDLCIHSNKFEIEKIPSARATQKFVKRFNDIFDFFNKDDQEVSPFLSRLSLEENAIFLDSMKDYIQNIDIVIKPGKRKKSFYAFKGLLQNIRAIQEMSKDLFHRYDNLKHIATRRLNQDILENLFSFVRGKGEFNRNPSSMQFNSDLKFIMNKKIILPKLITKYANCSVDGEIGNIEYSTTIENSDIDVELNQAMELNNVEIDSEENSIIEINLLEDIQTDNAITYFVSYVCNKIINKIKCEECTAILLKEKSIIVPREYLLRQKFSDKQENYSAASDTFFEICRKSISYFQQTFKENINLKNIKQFYMDACIQITKKDDPFWYSTDNACHDHRIKALDYLLLILIRKNCQWLLDDKKNININWIFQVPI